MRFLIVDESSAFRRSLATMLRACWPGAETEEWDPKERGTPSTAVARGGYSAVLIESTPGGEDGTEWVAQIRQDPNAPRLVVVMDLGLAGAGRAAMALDAASLASNPAAMGSLSGTTITAAAMPLELDFEFHGSDATPAEPSNKDGVHAVPALYAVYRDDRLSYGIGAYSFLGLSFDAGNQWEGRRVIEKAGLAPSISRRPLHGRRRID